MVAASDELAIIQALLARRTPEAQVDLLFTSWRSEIRRRRTIEEAHALLQKELAQAKAALAETPASDATDQLRQELADTRAALLRTEQDRDLLYATLIQNVPSSPEKTGSDEPACGRRIFSDRKEALGFIGQLLRPFGLDRYWSGSGLTLGAGDISRGEGHFSQSERVLLLAAHDLISEDPGLAFLDIVEHLRGEPLEALCNFILAFAKGRAALDHWLLTALNRTSPSAAREEVAHAR